MIEGPRKARRFLRRISQSITQTERIEDRLEQLTQDFAAHSRETRLMLGSLALPDRALWAGQPVPAPGTPGVSVFPGGALCRQVDFSAPYFNFWTMRLGEGLRYHRKLWEFVFICQALWERGLMSEGRRALGFGVGTEPLTALFASHGCEVLATDLSMGEAVDMGWTSTNQHAAGKEALRKPAICPDAMFDAHVAFEECDMNRIPDRYTDFDFCWSACALEHLGSIEHGLAFIERSVACLKPGGWAIHTTEYNISSDEETVDDQYTVLFRKRDFEALAARLTAQGHTVYPINYDPGDEPVDQYIDVAPYRPEPHLKIALAGFAATSIGLIIQRGPAA
jgi:SAM-dependent methyltransferase